MSNSEAAHRRFVVLISGRGSNMQQIITQAQAGNWSAAFVRVISNESDAPGIDWAKARGLATSVLPHRDFASRDAFDARLADMIEQEAPDYVLLAGFMRILTPAFVSRFKNKLVNIHPSLLPDFTGLHTHKRALEAGVAKHGCTVHLVTDQLDHGPIIAQAALAVRANDTPASLQQRVLKAEHVLYPQVVQWLAQGQVQVNESGQINVTGVSSRHLWIES